MYNILMKMHGEKKRKFLKDLFTEIVIKINTWHALYYLHSDFKRHFRFDNNV